MPHNLSPTMDLAGDELYDVHIKWLFYVQGWSWVMYHQSCKLNEFSRVGDE